MTKRHLSVWATDECASICLCSIKNLSSLSIVAASKKVSNSKYPQLSAGLKQSYNITSVPV